MLERVNYWLKIHRFKMPPCIMDSQFTSPFEPQNILLNSCYPFGSGMTKNPPLEPVSYPPAGTFSVLRHMFKLTMVWLRRFLYFWQPFSTNLMKTVLRGIARRALPILEKIKKARELKRNKNNTEKMMEKDSCQERCFLKSHTNHLSERNLLLDCFGEDIEQVLIDSSSITVNNMHLEEEGISELCLISPTIVFDLRNNWQDSSGKDMECVTVKSSEHVSLKLLEEDTCNPEIFIKELDLCGCLENTLDCLNPNGQLNFNKGLDEILETTFIPQELEKNMKSNQDPPIGGKQSLICSLGSSKDEKKPEMKQKSGKNEATCNMESPTNPSSFQSSLVLSLFYSPLEDEEDDNDDSSEDWWSEDEMEDSSKTQICSDGNNSGDQENYQDIEEEDSVQKIVFENLCGALSMNSDPLHPLCFSKPIQALTDFTIASLNAPNHQETVSSYWTRTSSKLEESCHLPKQSLPREHLKVERNQETYLCCQPSLRKSASPLPAETVSQQEIQVKKKVRFSPVVTVHSLVVWDYASRAARRGPWEEMARDRCRFHRKITQMAAILEPCLAKDHRDKVWKRIHGVSTSC
ncbi:PREDICTED: protein phosphatase 1 regulatory subunit 15A-like [Thamnophis sirtalis]|uniref:Protein phosphatase 1 regulatory subunit 15A n=1 Tax=Thamnophis sirtalis TaxID=35019 RepID=A0A6I9YHS6_9SAUR|nr:PREDICTED: protein phosphatase 1 regulatory subunit 15A-like [Thamnophis sirtalis]